MKIKLTSLNNQEKISKLLSLIDDLIEQYSNIEELYILTKKSYMQQLFNENNHDKQLVEIKIKDIAKITSGVGFSEKLQGEINGVVPFFKVSDMNNSGNEKIMTTSNNYVSYNAINNNNFNVIESKSIIFAKVGAAVALERKRICNEKFLIDNNMMAISPNSNVNLEYLYHRLTNFRLMRICQEGALPSIKGSDVGNIKFKFHPISKQEKISKLLSSIDDLIILVRKQQKQYKQLKKYHLNNIFKNNYMKSREKR